MKLVILRTPTCGKKWLNHTEKHYTTDEPKTDYSFRDFTRKCGPVSRTLHSSEVADTTRLPGAIDRKEPLKDITQELLQHCNVLQTYLSTC
jgi:hypothetical protein